MIQRIQTIYLIIIVVLQVLAMQFSYLTFEKDGKLFELHSTGIIGIKTKNQAITEYPKSHNIFIIRVNTNMIIKFRNALLIAPLKISIKIWINENPIYTKAGAHNPVVNIIIL